MIAARLGEVCLERMCNLDAALYLYSYMLCKIFGLLYCFVDDFVFAVILLSWSHHIYLFIMIYNMLTIIKIYS